jgi:hypothetical protein
MLQDIKSLQSQKLSAKDGEIGRVADLYFDDKSWAIRESLSTPPLVIKHSLGKWLKLP